MDLKESWIEEQAVNASALKNGKAIYQSGKFIKLYHSQDDTFYMGECSGSGSKKLHNICGFSGCLTSCFSL